ncbi:hypothetical protein FVE85_3036 [Porphyridium purpureum]|uniref:Uncharacterized protein n=1 Tax=Porphyridium purpureum TaxID=35688 RepID=A0A5J4YU70_PORPP|nr:hypothetical protein FVE85_3036 [Porphyridium purpureum]|eukprot:POR8970..scf227_4
MNSGEYGGGPNSHARYRMGRLPENVNLQNAPGRSATPMPTTAAAKQEEKMNQNQIELDAMRQKNSVVVPTTDKVSRKVDGYHTPADSDKILNSGAELHPSLGAPDEKNIFGDLSSSSDEEPEAPGAVPEPEAPPPAEEPAEPAAEVPPAPPAEQPAAVSQPEQSRKEDAPAEKKPPAPAAEAAKPATQAKPQTEPVKQKAGGCCVLQ